MVDEDERCANLLVSFIVVFDFLRRLSGKQKNKPITMFDSGACDWLVLVPLLFPTPTV